MAAKSSSTPLQKYYFWSNFSSLEYFMLKFSLKTCLNMSYHVLNFWIPAARVWHVRLNIAGKGGGRTFGQKIQKMSARANDVYFSAFHKFSKRACSKTLPSKIWGFNLTILKSCTGKAVFLFTLKNQLFPCFWSWAQWNKRVLFFSIPLNISVYCYKCSKQVLIKK